MLKFCKKNDYTQYKELLIQGMEIGHVRYNFDDLPLVYSRASIILSYLKVSMIFNVYFLEKLKPSFVSSDVILHLVYIVRLSRINTIQLIYSSGLLLIS